MRCTRGGAWGFAEIVVVVVVVVVGSMEAAGVLEASMVGLQDERLRAFMVSVAVES